MNNYQAIRKDFLQSRGFDNTPAVRLEYDKCKQDSLSDEEIAKKLRKRFKNGREI